MTRCLGVIGLLVGLCGCDGPEPIDAGPGVTGHLSDAGLDAGQRDGGVDAGVDGGTDAGTDAGPTCMAFADRDEDGFGDPTAALIVPCGVPLPAQASPNADDCDDMEPTANPDTTAPRARPTVGGSWDWNCDGVVEFGVDTWETCDGASCCGPGWRRTRATIPACGEVADFRTSGCMPTTRTQGCL